MSDRRWIFHRTATADPALVAAEARALLEKGRQGDSLCGAAAPTGQATGKPAPFTRRRTVPSGAERSAADRMFQHPSPDRHPGGGGSASVGPAPAGAVFRAAVRSGGRPRPGPPPKPRSPQPPTPCAPNNTAKDAPAGASFLVSGSLYLPPHKAPPTGKRCDTGSFVELRFRCAGYRSRTP